MMNDIIGSLLESSDPQGATYKSALAAQKLYQEAMFVCERFGLPHTSIEVEVWSQGSHSGATKKRIATALKFNRETGHFVSTRGFAPGGPPEPFGFSWLVLFERPAGLKHRKLSSQDVYKIDVAKWCYKNPGEDWKESFYTFWRRSAYLSNVYVYQSKHGDYCDGCKETLPANYDVYLSVWQRLYCQSCAEATNPTLDYPKKPGGDPYTYKDHCAKVAKLLKRIQGKALQVVAQRGFYAE